MKFDEYLELNEDIKSKYNKMSADEFINKIKSEGLFGFDVLKKIPEEELRKILDKENESNLKESLADQLGLKKKTLSWKDRLAVEKEKYSEYKSNRSPQNREQQHFNGTKLSDHLKDDEKHTDIETKLHNAMNNKKPEIRSTNNSGYSRLSNPDNKKTETLKSKLEREANTPDKKPVQKQNVQLQSKTEYSKRTLLAIADRMDFKVFCKFRKADGQIRTGNFQIGNSDAQRTAKQDTIIVIDLDQSKKDKPEWRTIPLNRIISIKPI